ncbi:hypothetical protein B0T17DRAFT_503353 [Bombardia bombarda]|uniref:Uncharacterized protein n=1 Tax=Bombardia bombarda TaxID=252184 RepID=A0AA40CFW7_9PEZI|nr:hypothetical protein B0T17DRAFT_503353 [Bombardia bombarda]
MLQSACTSPGPDVIAFGVDASGVQAEDIATRCGSWCLSRPDRYLGCTTHLVPSCVDRIQFEHCRRKVATKRYKGFGPLDLGSSNKTGHTGRTWPWKDTSRSMESIIMHKYVVAVSAVAGEAGSSRNVKHKVFAYRSKEWKASWACGSLSGSSCLREALITCSHYTLRRLSHHRKRGSFPSEGFACCEVDVLTGLGWQEWHSTSSLVGSQKFMIQIPEGQWCLSG